MESFHRQNPNVPGRNPDVLCCRFVVIDLIFVGAADGGVEQIGIDPMYVCILIWVNFFL